jgi:hypothetical protein
MKKVWMILLFFGLCSFEGQGQSTNDLKTHQVEGIQKQKIKVFPNPAMNVVNILGLKNSNRANILISDVYGNVVLSHQWRIKNKAINIPIPNLNSGIYIVSIRSQEQSVQAKFYKK